MKKFDLEKCKITDVSDDVILRGNQPHVPDRAVTTAYIANNAT